MNQINHPMDPAVRLKNLEEENELLLLQLHQVQEELEKYYLRNKELEARGPAASFEQASGHVWVDEELPVILAEKIRLQARVDVQQQVHRLEAENALDARLGKMLVDAVDTPGGFMALPGKLLSIWRQNSQMTPPDSLGGKDFGKAISAFKQGGFDAVEKLLAGQALSPAMQANAYTALARAIMKGDRSNAAQAARRAHVLDPKSFRLKWLAFRLHEAGEVIEAEAMLDILPADIAFSESEQRQASQLRYEAKRAREQAARQESRFDQRHSASEQQMRVLAQARDQQARLAEERGQELEAVKQAKAQLEQEKRSLLGQHEVQARLAEERGQELEAVKQAKAQLEQEKQGLIGQNEAQTRLAADRLKQLNELQQKLQSFQVSETELKTRQQIMHEEMARAEAQLDLIKELLLREPGL